MNHSQNYAIVAALIWAFSSAAHAQDAEHDPAPVVPPVVVPLVAVPSATTKPTTASVDAESRPIVTGPLTLSRAVEIALQNSPILRGATAELDIAAARVRAAQAASKPSLSATTFLTTGSESGPIFNSPDGVAPQNLFAVPRGPFANQNLMFMLPVLSGGRLQSLTRQAQALRQSSQFEVDAMRLDVALETRTAYRQVLLALEMQKVAAARQSAIAEQLQNDTAAEKAGRVPQLFVLRDQAEDADAGQDVTNAARDVEIALISLRAVMGVSSDSSFSLPDTFDTSTQSTPGGEEFSTSVLQDALKQRPELQGARARLESARQGRSVATGASKFQASFTGMADASRARGGATSGLSVGVVVGVPIFDGGLRRAARDEATAEITRAQAEVSRLEIQVEREVATGQATVEAALKNVTAAQSAVGAAQEGYRVTLLRYQSGRATNAETLDALAALTRARSNQTRSLYEAQIAFDQLKRATGASIKLPSIS